MKCTLAATVLIASMMAAASPVFAEGRELPRQGPAYQGRVIIEGLPSPWAELSDIQDLRFADGLMQGTSIGGDPYIENKANLSADAVKAMEIRMSMVGSDVAQLFFSPYSQENSLRFTVIPDGRMHTYVVPLATRAGWKGKIDNIRLDPGERAMTRFAIASVRPVAEIGQPQAAFFYEGPETLVLPENGKAALSLRLVLTGGAEARGLRLQPSADGAVKAAFAADAVPPLAFGQMCEPLAIDIAADKVGKGTVKFAVAGAQAEALSISCMVAFAGVQAVRPPGEPITPLILTGVEGNTTWQAASGRVVASAIASGGLAVEPADGVARLDLAGRIICPDRFVLHASGSGPAMLIFRDETGARCGIVFPLSEQLSAITMPAPESAIGKVIELESLTLDGRDTAHIAGLFAVSAAQPRVALHGKQLRRNPIAELGYIAETRHPLHVAVLAAERFAGGDLQVTLTPAFPGSAPTARQPLVFTAADAKPPSGSPADVMTINLDGPEHPGIYDLTVSGRGLASATFRITFVEAREALPWVQAP